MAGSRTQPRSAAALLGAVGAGLGAAGVVWLFTLTPWHSRLEGPTLDARFRLRPPTATIDKVVTIDIDTPALDREKAWPWPRDRHTRLLAHTTRFGVRALGFDIFFPEASPPASLTRDEFFDRHGQITADDFPDYDSEFARALAEADHAFLAQVFAFHAESRAVADPRKLERAEQRLREFVRAGHAIVVDAAVADLFPRATAPDAIPLPRFAGAARGVGSVQVQEDADGVVRHFPLLVRYDLALEDDGAPVPCLFASLPLVMACDVLDVRLSELELNLDRTVRLPPRGERGAITIPINEDGTVLINWAGRWEDTFHHVSYAMFEGMEMSLQWAAIKQAVSERGPALWDGGPPALADVLADYADSRQELLGMLQTLWGAHVYEELLAEDPSMTAEAAVPMLLGAQAENPTAFDQQQQVFQNVAAHLAAFRGGTRPEGVLETVWADAIAVADAIKAEGGPTPADHPYYFHPPQRVGDTVVFAGRSAPLLREAVCFYGLVAAGTHDMRPTPVSSVYPMLGVHPNLYNSLVTGQLLKEMPRAWRVPMYVAFGLLVALYAVGQGAARVAVMTLLVLAAYVGGAYLLFVHAQWVMEVVGPVLVVSGSAGVVAYQNYRREEQQRKFIRGAFEQYMNPNIVEQIASSPEGLTLGGQDLDATAFFSDVAGFTTISESLSSQELVALLNEYLTAMTEIVFEYDGLLDKYEGDAIIAIFGAPIQTDDHATKSCYASLDMQRKLGEMRAKWQREGRQELTARIGLNSGPMTVGNMGSTMRFDYTMMGDTVNLASRLEGANKEYATHLMCSEFTLERCNGSVLARELDLLRVKGKNLPVRVYEVYAKARETVPPDLATAVEQYLEGLALYRDRQFALAIPRFEAALAARPDDGPSQTYLERCRVYLDAPPPPDWDGVFTMLTK